MSIYAEFAALPTELEVFCELFGGPVFHGVETIPGGVSTLPTFAELTDARMVFVPVALNSFRSTFPEVAIWKCDWLVFAIPTVDVQEGHMRYDDAHAYRITAEPSLDYAFILAPAAKITMSQIPAAIGPILTDENGDPLLGVA